MHGYFDFHLLSSGLSAPSSCSSSNRTTAATDSAADVAADEWDNDLSSLLISRPPERRRRPPGVRRRRQGPVFPRIFLRREGRHVATDRGRLAQRRGQVSKRFPLPPPPSVKRRLQHAQYTLPSPFVCGPLEVKQSRGVEQSCCAKLGG